MGNIFVPDLKNYYIRILRQGIQQQAFREIFWILSRCYKPIIRPVDQKQIDVFM